MPVCSFNGDLVPCPTSTARPTPTELTGPKVAGDDNPAASDDLPSSPAEAADSASPAKHSQVDLFAPEEAVGAESAA